MKTIKWDSLKNEKLKKTRGVSFEEILNGTLITVLVHPTRKGQRVLVYEYKKYCWGIPCVVGAKHIFFKTAYPSRKLTKIYLKKG